MRSCCFLLAALTAAGCADVDTPAPLLPTMVTPPQGNVPPVAPGTLAERLAAARAGDVLQLEPGTHPGPLVVRTPVTIFGPRSAIVRSDGTGTTILVEAAGARLCGFTVSGSGNRFDLVDAAVRVQADDVVVEGLLVREALFGILVEKAARAMVRGNTVLGSGQEAVGLRGDGIRLWESKDTAVLGNTVRACRDMVVWYSERARIEDNEVSQCRYGTHFMYGTDTTVRGNRYVDDVVGVFVMYSRRITLEHNVMARAGGAAGVGLGVKESGDVRVRHNLIAHDTVGIFLDNSPLDIHETNEFEGNSVRLCGTAITFHGRAARNTFRAGRWQDNAAQIEVHGGGDALAATWQENWFDDYQGYDLDGDGYGDIAYQVARLSSQLTGRCPALAFWRGTPALAAVDLAGRAMPLLQPKPLLIDARPRMAPPPEVARAN